MSATRLNDEDRRQWINNDEGLYDLWRASEYTTMRAFIRENHKLIDAAILPVLAGTKPAHHLKYG